MTWPRLDLITLKSLLITLWLLNGVMVRAQPCAITNESAAFAFQGATRDANGRITLSWDSCSDHLYEVQVLEQLPIQTSWSRRALMIGGIGSTSWLETNAPAFSQQFYRVQRLRFHGDEDEDGYTNLQEYRAGTALNDAENYPSMIPPGLGVWWRFDEFGGSLLDSSLNGHTALLYGASFLVPGVTSNTMVVRMQNNTYFETPCDTNLMPTDTFTFTSWINTTAHSWDAPVSRHTFAGSVATGLNLNRTLKTFQLWTERGDVYFWQNSCQNVTNIASGRLVTPYQWHLLAVVNSPTNVSLYVDGRLVTNNAINCPLPVSQWLRLGGRVRQVVTTNEFRLDDVRIYRRALAPAEIQSLYDEDTDGDGIPNWWTSTFFGHDIGQASDITLATDDHDGDGYSNLQEYQLRTRPNAAYSCPADPPRNLVAWWKLDEGMGTTVFDSSLNGRHGYVTGGNPAGSWTTGYLSNAVTLGGPSGSYIQVPYQPGTMPTQEFTLTGWVKPHGQGVLAANCDSGAQGNGNYQLQFGPDHIELWFSPSGDGNYDALHFNPNWSTNEWHHIAVCYGDDNLAVFVDGELKEGRIVPGPLSPVSNPITIGIPELAEASSVDDVRLYNRALGTNEIASMSRGNGLPVTMIVGQTASLRAFGADESGPCQWALISGRGFFTNTVGCTSEFRPSWSGAVTVQVVYASSGVLRTNRSRTAVAFPSLSRISDWNDWDAPNPIVQYNNNCYNFATDLRTDSYAQPGGEFRLWDCLNQTSDAISDGLRAGVDLDDLCHTSGLPDGHIVALLTVPPNHDYHWMRMEADGTWSGKYGSMVATPFDNSGQPITDPRTAWFAPIFGTYQWEFCGFFWVGPDVHIH